LTKKFGKDSSEALIFNKCRSEVYDSSFAYRFFYQLRNYCQHCGLPLEDFSYVVEYDRQNKVAGGKMRIQFDRDSLLNSYDSWKQVKTDLLKMEEKFELLPLLAEMITCIHHIEEQIESILNANLVKAAELIRSLTNHLRNNDGGEIVVVYNIQTKNKQITKFESLHIPFDVIDAV